MPTKPIATRLPEDVVNHIEEVAQSPATAHATKSEVVREIVTAQFE